MTDGQVRMPGMSNAETTEDGQNRMHDLRGELKTSEWTKCPNMEIEFRSNDPCGDPRPSVLVNLNRSNS